MTQQNRREFNVTPADTRTRLDRFLAKTAPEFSRSRIQTLIRQGYVTVNGAVPRARDMVEAGDRIALVEPPKEAIDLAPEKIALSVLFEDGDLIELETEPLGRLHVRIRDDLKRTWARETRLQRQEKGLEGFTPQLTGKYAKI